MSNARDNTIGADLCALATLLNDYKLCKDVTPLNSAGNSSIMMSDDANWTYELNKITFEADEVGGRIPFESADISISLSMSISSIGIQNGAISDPLSRLICDFEIDAFRLNDQLDILYSSMHLDRHLVEVGNGDTAYSHPFYHFTYGGNKMEEKGDIYGNAIILPTPRFVYPPMDAILGIDFILQNYISKNKIIKLISNPDYIKIIKNSQTRLWKPFFTSLYSYWDNGIVVSANFSPFKVLPLLYK